METSDNVRRPSAQTLFAWIAVGLLCVSLVVPVALNVPVPSLPPPLVGSINILDMQSGLAYWFLGFAITAAVGVLTKIYRLLIAAGVLVIVSMLEYVYNIDEGQAVSLVSLVQGDCCSAKMTAAINSVHLQWGVALVVLAGVALVIAGVLRADAATVPDLVAVNRKQFIGGAIAAAVLLFGIAVLRVALIHCRC